MEEEQQFEYSTLYTGDGQPVQVLTPRRGQPPVVAPARGRSTTRIDSPILQAIARRTGKQPQRRAASESPRDPPPHFDLDTGDHDDQDPPVDPDDPGADNNNDRFWMTIVTPVDLAVPAVPAAPGVLGDLVDLVPPSLLTSPNEQLCWNSSRGSRVPLRPLVPFSPLSAVPLTALNPRARSRSQRYSTVRIPKLKTFFVNLAPGL
ncbi:hypothetical protein LENED_005852 [Lentinula edodes]|uniref:Uncharacterized protein n=1 Tax=Lentinula edodes TaxID=5353 RepID=A0A1Q3EA37_LENED|nr:hypothetical protein LENED_005852 [Lentinula edodes]